MGRTTWIALFSLLALAAPALPAGAAATDAAGPNYVTAVGGTPLSNGVFAPGSALCDAAGCTVVGAPFQIDRGTDFTFVMGDLQAVANGHQIVSMKSNKRTRRPLFASDVLTTPGDQDLVVTSKLKPGSYPFRCTIHFGMFGVLEVVGS